MKAETHEYVHRCALEAKQMADDIQEETQTLGVLEGQAAEVLKVLDLFK